VVEVSGLLKVLPEPDAKLQAGSVGVSQGGTGTTLQGGQIATQIFKLNFENANNLVPVLRPLISPNNTINVNPGSNALVITDYADNLQRIAKIIAALDTPAATDVEVVPVRHAVASDIAQMVQRFADSSAGGTPGAAPAALRILAGGDIVNQTPAGGTGAVIFGAADDVLLEAAGDIRKAQKLLGHTTIGMTEHYLRSRKGDRVTPSK
jgi:type II secretory pathway component GspD/PulD (secretin)